jgi:hypothetical protein
VGKYPKKGGKVLIKILGLSTAPVVFVIYLMSLYDYYDPLFYIVSSSVAINLTFVVIAGFGAWISFAKKTIIWPVYTLCISLATLLGLVSAAGFLLPFFGNYSFDTLGLLNYMVMGELAVIFAISALTQKHEKIPHIDGGKFWRTIASIIVPSDNFPRAYR